MLKILIVNCVEFLLENREHTFEHLKTLSLERIPPFLFFCYVDFKSNQYK